jgi:hypothetical protein
MNLVSTILQFLAPAIINKIASSLGINQGLAGKAIAAAIPAILAGLTGATARPGGASSLSNVLAKQDPGLLDGFANMIGGAGQKALTDNGIGALSSLLGGASTNALTGAIGKFAGIDSSKTGSLLGMVAPVVMGQLAKSSSGLDANGLTNLLNGQKANIAAAMPEGFAGLLQGSGLLDSVAGQLKSAPSAAAPGGSSLTRLVLPVAVAAIAAVLFNSYGCNRTTDTTVAPATPPAATAPATPAVPSADLASLTTSALGALTTSLNGITDEATAKTALPGLSDIATRIADVKTAAGLLTGDARQPIAAMITSALPGITAAVEKAVGIPGVGTIINPVLQPMVANLGELAK